MVSRNMNPFQTVSIQLIDETMICELDDLNQRHVIDAPLDEGALKHRSFSVSFMFSNPFSHLTISGSD
jgi:hypothetical protein